MSEEKSTADYRTYPKGPKFGLIVVGAALFLILALIGIVLFLHRDVTKVDPHRPTTTPNSMVRPLLQEVQTVATA